jgi:hypothetical protein
MLNFTHPGGKETSVRGTSALGFPVMAARLAGGAALFGCAMLSAQPKIGGIEIFGLRKVGLETIRRAMDLKPGDPMPRSKGGLEEKLAEIGGVVQAHVEAWCCEAGGVVLYVGILERGGTTFEYRLEPAAELALPGEIVAAYRDFTVELHRAVAAGETGEDLSRGHSLMANINCRVLQERFLGMAELHEAALRQVLRESADPEQRAVAAYVIGYAPLKRTVVNDLQLALRDPDASVRANAARALKAVAVLGESDPDLGIKVESTWFVEMLNSLVFSDRLEAARTLLRFTDKPGGSTFRHIRDRALPALLEMARWRQLEHALPAYLLLGRVAEVEEGELLKAWLGGEREKMIERLRRKLR